MINLDSVENPTELIPAATVILIRENEGVLETLMLRRNRSLKAFGGAWVFPGGRVDDVDLPGGVEIERAKHTAVREAKEETGLVLNPDDLASLSLWIPPPAEIRRFSTWFFVARAPEGKVTIDEGEIHDYRWMCPKQMIANTPDEDMPIMPPTYVSLHELSQFNQVDQAIEELTTREPEHFETRFYRMDDGFTPGHRTPLLRPAI